MKTLTWQKPGQQNVAQELIKIIINYVAELRLDIFVDKCSIEIFVDGGRIAMTNLVFPTKPYDTLRFYTEGGEAEFSNMKIYKLGM